MNITYKYVDQRNADEYPDVWPSGLSTLPRKGDCVTGLKNNYILEVLAVTFEDQYTVNLVIGCVPFGVANPIFKHNVFAQSK